MGTALARPPVFGSFKSVEFQIRLMVANQAGAPCSPWNLV